MGVWLSLAALALMSMISIGGGQPSPFLTTIAAFVIAGGIISRDVASGALQVILTRPILRGEYLLGRWLGAITLLAAFVAASFAITFGFDRIASLAGWNTGAGISWGSAGIATGQNFFQGALAITIVLFFSTFLRGFGDVLGYVLGGLLLNLLPQLFEGMHKPGLARAARVFLDNAAPRVPWADIVHGEKILQAATGQYLLAVAVYLVAAVLIFNRREFSYGAD